MNRRLVAIASYGAAAALITGGVVLLSYCPAALLVPYSKGPSERELLMIVSRALQFLLGILLGIAAFAYIRRLPAPLLLGRLAVVGALVIILFAWWSWYFSGLLMPIVTPNAWENLEEAEYAARVRNLRGQQFMVVSLSSVPTILGWFCGSFARWFFAGLKARRGYG